VDGVDTILNLIGSVALLLWGVGMVRRGVTGAFGAALRKAMAACAHDRFTAFGAGLVVTLLLQSSTATALLLASFAGRGFVPLPIAIAVMLGANVGTALMAQILSFDLSWLSPLLLAVGALAFSWSESERRQETGRIAIGLGLMLLSLGMLAHAIEPLAKSPSFLAAIEGLQDEYVIAVAVGAAVTWAMHSSLSMVLLIMSFAQGGIIQPMLAVSLVIGANIGSALAPYFDQPRTDVEARRVPLSNLITRGVVGLVLLVLLGEAVAWLSAIDSAPARLAVNFHMAFSLTAAVVFLPLIGPLATLCRRLVPDRPVAADPTRPRHLDPGVLDSPVEALACATRETLELGDRIADMLDKTMQVFEHDDQQAVRSIHDTERAADRLYEAIKLYLIQISRRRLTESESRRYVQILTFTTNLEHIGDIMDRNLMELAARKMSNNLAFSPEGLADLKEIHGRLVEHLKLALNVFTSGDLALARRLVAEKAAVRELEFKSSDRHFARLREGQASSIETSSIHLSAIRDLKRINSHLTSVAYPILEAAGELTDTRLKAPQPLIRTPAGS
jgi:phosphate:Na+ symporter